MSTDKFTPQRNYFLPSLQITSRLAIGSSSDFVSTWVSGEIYHDLEEALNSIKSIPSLHGKLIKCSLECAMSKVIAKSR
jgi:hypothetical protein